MSCESNLIDYLKENKLVLATAESCTAGEIMSTLAKQGNCGNCLFIGYAVYSPIAKIKELDVKQSTIDKFTLTSEAIAREMVQGVFKHDEINIAIATTGIIGKEPIDGISPGTICFAWGFKKNKDIILFSATKKFQGSSDEIVRQATQYSLNSLKKYHSQIKANDESFKP